MPYDARFYIASGISPLVLTVPEGATPGSTLATAFVDDTDPTKHLWRHDDDGYLVHDATGLVMDVFNGEMRNGTNVIAYTPNSPRSDNQRWDFLPTGQLSSRNGASYVVDVPKSDPHPGPLQIWSRMDGTPPNQQWRMVPYVEVPPGTTCYHIESGIPGLVLGVTPGAVAGTSVVTTTVDPVSPALNTWQLLADGRIRHLGTGLVLSAAGGDGGDVLVVDPSYVPERSYWDLTSGSTIQRRVAPGSPAYVLDVPESDPAQGRAVQTWSPVPGTPPNQTWHATRYVQPFAVDTGRALVLTGAPKQGFTADAPRFGTGDLTLEAWVQTTSGGPVFALDAGLTAAVLVVEPGGALRFAMRQACLKRIVPPPEWPQRRFDVTFLDLVAATAATEVTDGDWHHVAAVLSNGAATLFLDGVAVPPAAHGQVRPGSAINVGSGSIDVGFAPPLLPAHPAVEMTEGIPLASRAFAGNLDEARVWTSARTASEIALGAHHRVPASDPNLAGRWSFDNDDVKDSSSNGRHGHPQGTLSFADSDVDLVGPGEPYMVAQARLIQDWKRVDGKFTETAAYRTVLTCRAADGSAHQAFLSFYADEPVTLHLPDGTDAVLPGGPVPWTVQTSPTGQLTFAIEAAGSLTCPHLKVRADFMAVGERLVVAPDKHAHAALAGITGAALLGRDATGQALPDVTAGKKPRPLPEAATTEDAEALAQVLRHVMSAVVTHTVQGDRPQTRAASDALDVPVATPYVPRYQYVSLAASGFDAATDTLATHFLGSDVPVTRVVLPENMPNPHWQWVVDRNAAGGGFSVLSPEQAAAFRDAAGAHTTRDVSSAMSFWDLLESAKKFVLTTVEHAETKAKTLVAIVFAEVSGSPLAAAALHFLKDAVDFAGAMLERVGAKVADMVSFLRDLLAWDDYLETQAVLEGYLVGLKGPVTATLNNVAVRARGALADLRKELKASLPAYRSHVLGMGVDLESHGTGQPLGVREGYLPTLLAHHAASPGNVGDVSSGVEKVRGDNAARAGSLTTALAPHLDSLPAKVTASGVLTPFADPTTILTEGTAALLNALEALVDPAFDAAEDAVDTLLASAQSLIDMFYEVGQATVEIPLVSDFVADVVGLGKEHQSAFGVLTLVAAVPLTIMVKAAGHEGPVFPPDIARTMTSGTWLTQNLTLGGPPPNASPAPRVEPYADLAHVVPYANLAGNIQVTIGYVLWEVAALTSDAADIAKANREPFDMNVWVGRAGYIGQLVVFVASLSPPDLGTNAKRWQFGMYLSAVVPIVSNGLLLSKGDTWTWGTKADALVTGIYGVALMGLAVYVAYLQSVEDDESADTIGFTFAQAFLGDLSWVSQLAKLAPTPQGMTAMMVVDFVSYTAGVTFGLLNTMKVIGEIRHS